VLAILERHGFDIARLHAAPETAGPRGPLPWTRPIPLPFVWIHGRRDATISVMGANIYPEDVESIVYRDPDLVPRLHSFLLAVAVDESGTPRPSVAEFPAAMRPIVETHGLGAGPFAGDATRIKQRRIARTPAADAEPQDSAG